MKSVVAGIPDIKPSRWADSERDDMIDVSAPRNVTASAIIHSSCKKTIDSTLAAKLWRNHEANIRPLINATIAVKNRPIKPLLIFPQSSAENIPSQEIVVKASMHISKEIKKTITIFE